MFSFSALNPTAVQLIIYQLDHSPTDSCEILGWLKQLAIRMMTLQIKQRKRYSKNTPIFTKENKNIYEDGAQQYISNHHWSGPECRITSLNSFTFLLHDQNSWKRSNVTACCWAPDVFHVCFYKEKPHGKEAPIGERVTSCHDSQLY